MDNYLYRLIGSFGTLITTIFLIDFENRHLLVNVGLILVAAFAVVYLVLDIYRAITSPSKSFDRTTEKGRAKIAKYLVRQLEKSGSVVMFSKDLTWVQPGSAAEMMLKKKASAGELTLYVEKPMAITSALKALGAEIRTYNKPAFKPASRFTILDYRAGKARIMVGISDGDKHLIKNYAMEDKEVVDLAKDFISLLNTTAKKL